MGYDNIVYPAHIKPAVCRVQKSIHRELDRYPVVDNSLRACAYFPSADLACMSAYPAVTKDLGYASASAGSEIFQLHF